MLQGREGVRFLSFRGERGSVFWASGEGGGPFSGFQGRERGPSSHVWGLAGSWGNALAAPGGMHRAVLHYPLFKEIQ